MLFAGNDAEYRELPRYNGICTVGSPAIGKNVMAIGSSSSGSTRLTTTDVNGDEYDGMRNRADIDTVSSFSSYGPTRDDRIKPEVVAPVDQMRISSRSRSVPISLYLAAVGALSHSPLRTHPYPSIFSAP